MDEEPCAKNILTTLARRAYRGSVTDVEVERLLAFYRAARGNGGFEDGIRLALERLLVSPAFLFRLEGDPATAKATPYRVTDLELASRLSFFLWSSIPDDALLSLAAKGRLQQPAVLEQQTKRMLADPRSAALVDNFFSQWLELRPLPSFVPDAAEFAEFDENLRTALQREIDLFLRSQVVEDRSVVELLTAKETFLNERLARHYGIANVRGSGFRRVTLPDPERFGLLGKGAILAATSYPNRTSPVLRGKWVLGNLFGAPPPDPPPNVPGLKDLGPTGQPASVRERLELHRKNPACANCHAQFDPLGLALENFSAIGAWRTKDAGALIDPSGSLVNGDQFEGPSGVRQLLVSHRREFVGTVTERLLAYALGRPVEHFDMPAIRTILRDSKAADYRWSSIFVAIVKSLPFRMRMPSDTGTKGSVASRSVNAR